MNVLAFLASPALAQLVRALPPPHRVSNTADWQTIVSAAREREYDVLVLDPCARDERACAHRLRALVGASMDAGGTPVVGYLSVTAEALRAAHTFGQLARPDVPNIIVHGMDDAPPTLASTIHRVVASTAASRIVSAAGNPFGALPSPVARAVEVAFHRPERVRSVSALALEADTTRRSLDRWLARAGLASARTLLACARANAAFHLIGAGRLRTARAAAIIGYASARALTRELHALTGRVPSDIPSPLTHAEFGAAIARHLRRPGVGAGRSASY